MTEEHVSSRTFQNASQALQPLWPHHIVLPSNTMGTLPPDPLLLTKEEDDLHPLPPCAIGNRLIVFLLLWTCIQLQYSGQHRRLRLNSPTPPPSPILYNRLRRGLNLNMTRKWPNVTAWFYLLFFTVTDPIFITPAPISIPNPTATAHHSLATPAGALLLQNSNQGGMFSVWKAPICVYLIKCWRHNHSWIISACNPSTYRDRACTSQIRDAETV